MIKRRFYRLEHKHKDDGSDSASSSSSSDSELEAQSAENSEPEAVAAEEEEEDEEEDQEVEQRKGSRVKACAPPFPCSSSSSGYESEDSSGDGFPADSSGLCMNDDEIESEKDGKKRLARIKTANRQYGELETMAKDDSIPDNATKHVIICKSVYKCRLCPGIVCLNNESLKAHLQSKRHARSENLLNNGRLKRILNSDGGEEVLEEGGETHAERHARILALAKEDPKKKRRGRQRQRKRLKRKKEGNDSSAKESGKNNAKRRRQGAK